MPAKDPDLEAMTDAELRAYKRDLTLEERDIRRRKLAAQEVLERKRAEADRKWEQAAKVAGRLVGSGDRHTEEAERLFALPQEELDKLDTGPLSREERRAQRSAYVVAPAASAAAQARPPQEGA